jgi:hypothetical protein
MQWQVDPVCRLANNVWYSYGASVDKKLLGR